MPKKKSKSKIICLRCKRDYSSKHSETGKEQWYNHRTKKGKVCKSCYGFLYMYHVAPSLRLGSKMK